MKEIPLGYWLYHHFRESHMMCRQSGEELSEESSLTNVVAWRKWCWHSLKEVMPANKTKQTQKNFTIKGTKEIFHVFEHRKDITIKAYPNLERSVTISSA